MGRKRQAHEPLNQLNRTKRKRFTLEQVNLPSTTTEGIVLVAGAGDFGQLGLGPDVLEKSRPAVVPSAEQIVDVVAGGMHTVLLTTNKTVITFGCNDEGALGRVTDGKEDAEFEAGVVELPAKVEQISAGDSHTAALLEDGRVFAWGTFRDSHGNMGMSVKGNEKLPFEIIPGLNIKKIASGSDHIVFLTNHGEVYTCGCAEQGQLGRTTERSSSRHARLDSKVHMSHLLQPTPIRIKPSSKLHFDNIWAGNYCTFAKVANSNDIYVFGLNNYNQLGLPMMGCQYIPKLSQEFSKYVWTTIACGQHHTVGLTETGEVYVIGRKEYGRLGLGKDSADATELQVVSGLKQMTIVGIGCGSSTSYAITDDGKLYAWGMGGNGQLGTGEEEDCFEPTLLQGKQVVARKVLKISGGGQHFVGLAEDTPANNI